MKTDYTIKNELFDSLFHKERVNQANLRSEDRQSEISVSKKE